MMWFGAPKPAGQPPGILQTECLFSGPLPLIFRSPANNNDAGGGGEVKRSDTVVADISYIPVSGNKRALEIKLTDTADPFFLWQCVLTEEDYFQMKREQSLVVDFGRFPAFLIGLVERCQQHFAEHQPLFAAHFYNEPQYAILSLVETNEYKQNSYAVLRMTPVSEAAMRKHLSTLMSTFKEEIQSLRTTGSLPPRSTLPTQTQQTQQQTQHHTPYTQHTPTRNYVERCKSLEERQAAMEQELRDLHEIKQKLETEASELRGQQRVLSADNERLQQEVYAFRSSAHGAGISARLAGLEQLVKEKDDALTRMNDLVQETREAKTLLESTIAQLRQQLQSAQEQQTTQQQDTQKLHDLIRKLQDDLRTAKSKVRSASTLAQEQERLRRDTQSQLDALKRDLQDVREQYERKLKQVGELEESKRTLQHELDDLRHLNEGNEKVISWLHRLIPDDRLTAIIENPDVTILSDTANGATAGTVNIQEQGHDTSTSDYPLAMRREVRQFFNDLGIQIDPETSLPRFTPEELAEKQTIGSDGNTEERREGLSESMSNLAIV